MRMVNAESASNELLPYLKRMILIRCFERRVLELHAGERVRGMCHVCIGQEAVAVGAGAAIQETDYITSTHRGHGHLLAKGGDPRRMMAELFGKETGCCKGRGGSMHMADFRLGHLGANGIVGGGIPIACGAALAVKYRNETQVVLCFFGDGATNQGVFHESLNMASLWKLPVILVCENNLYGVATHVSRTCPTRNVADKADAYGIPKTIVDGMDVLAVRSSVAEAVQRARTDGGPTFIECQTYSFHGHGTSPDRPYRTKEEEAAWQQRCPIETFKARLLKDKTITEKTCEDLWTEAEAIVDAAVRFAEQSADPDPLEVERYVLARK